MSDKIPSEIIAFAKRCFYKGFEKAENDDANCYTAWREESYYLIQSFSTQQASTIAEQQKVIEGSELLYNKQTNVILSLQKRVAELEAERDELKEAIKELTFGMAKGFQEKDKRIEELEAEVYAVREGAAQWEKEYNDCRKTLQDIIDAEASQWRRTSLSNPSQLPLVLIAAKEFLKTYQHE